MELLMIVPLLTCLTVLLWRWTRRAGVEVQQPTIEIGDAAVAQRALIQNANAFSNRPLAPFPVALVTGRRRRRSDNIITAPYGPHWRVLRCNLTSKLFHPSRLGFLAPLQLAAVEDLLVALSARGAGDVVVRDSLYAAVFALVARMCFGNAVARSDVRAAQRVMQEFVLGVGQAQAYAGSKLAKLVHWRRWRRFLASRGQMAEVFFPIIAARQRTCDGDGVFPYVDSLLDIQVPDEDDDAGAARRALTDDEMVSLVSEFLGAGTETVVACVEWTLAHLVTRPEVQNRLRREVDGEAGKGVMPDELRHRGMPYLHAVVLESLRMHPPVPFLMRDVRAEDAAAVAGKAATVPSVGLRVHFMLGDVGRDSNAWTDPDDFRPERFMPGGEAEDVGPLPGPNKEIRMMPFGAGRRFCPGMGLAMLHVKLFLAALVREFEWAPVPGEKVDLTELDGFFKTMKKPLRARIAQRLNAAA
jgi:cytochrome P450